MQATTLKTTEQDLLQVPVHVAQAGQEVPEGFTVLPQGRYRIRVNKNFFVDPKHYKPYAVDDYSDHDIYCDTRYFAHVHVLTGKVKMAWRKNSLCGKISVFVQVDGSLAVKCD